MLDIVSLSLVSIRTVAFLIIANALSAIPATWAVIKHLGSFEETSKPFDIPVVVGAVSHILLAFLLLLYAKQIARFMSRGLEGAAADPGLVPEFPGITDKLSVRQWDPPFPYDNTRVQTRDERYCPFASRAWACRRARCGG